MAMGSVRSHRLEQAPVYQSTAMYPSLAIQPVAVQRYWVVDCEIDLCAGSVIIPETHARTHKVKNVKQLIINKSNQMIIDYVL